MDRQRMQDYLGHVAAYRASGKKASEWAAEHGIPLRSLASWCAHAGRWQARLDGVRPSVVARPVGFVAARLPAGPAAGSVRIELQAGTTAVALELKRLASGTWGMVDTKEVLPALAERAKQRFCVMTPFIDGVGAPVVMNLFDRSRTCSRKSLIIRASPDGLMPPAVKSMLPALYALGVQIRSLRIDRPEGTGYETFHAKVLLADDDEAYVGSANMTKWSFEQSLELGVLVRGRAARTMAKVVDAVESVSTIVSV